MSSVLKLKENTQGQDWFVGDIHGCFSLLEKQLKQLEFNPAKDRLICTGDLIDRGPESERVLEFLQHNWFYSVLGNHDSFILGDLDNMLHLSLWFYNGGSWWWNIESDAEKQEFIEAFAQLPYIIEIETRHGLIGVVHAELPEGMNWPQLVASLDEKSTQDSLLWGRSRLAHQLSCPVDQIDILVSGHTMLNQPVRLANCVFIDMGACIHGEFALMNTEQLFSSNLSKNQVSIINKLDQ